jgi:hypothetical protein
MSANTSKPRTQSDAEPDASSGWRAEYAYQAVKGCIHAPQRDRLEAADRSEGEESFENRADMRRKR